MKTKPIAVKLTKKQWSAVCNALFEYSGICEGEAENIDGTISKTAGLSISKQLDKISWLITKQYKKGEL